jgi:SnoaL-like domain
MLSDRFRAAVERGDVKEAADLFSEDATFRGPVLFKPYEGRDQIAKVLQAAERVLGVGGEFRYVHQLEDPVDRVAILQFATVVDGKDVEGIDKLTFDGAGMITELKVKRVLHLSAVDSGGVSGIAEGRGRLSRLVR